MTIGPAPMIMIDLMSVRLGIVLVSGRRGSGRLVVDQADEPLEEIVRILRSGRRFGMVLDREDGAVGHPEPLVRAVEERDVRGHRIGRQALGLDPEAVILAGDLDLAGLEILDRMIGAAMAE